MIDLHSHILPGIDDGVRTTADAVELARSAHADGVAMIAATPHVREDYPTSVDAMEAAVAELRVVLANEQVSVELVSGGELALEEVFRLPLDELRRFSLTGSGRYLLVEFPYFGWPLALEGAIHRLATAGLTAVVAHPERNESVQTRQDILDVILERGALVQVTAASLDGRLGRRAQKAAVALVNDGRAHLIASDAHAPGVRQVGMSLAATAVRDSALAAWLTQDVPAAIAAGEHIPPRPAGPPRRRFRVRG